MQLKKQPTGFLDLPPEIRLVIYKMICISNHPICMEWVASPSEEVKREYTFDSATRIRSETIQTKLRIKPCMSRCVSCRPLPLLLCNKTVHKEATSVLYGGNFKFDLLNAENHEWLTIYAWLLDIGPYNRALLTKLTIHHNQTKAVFREGCLPERLCLYNCGIIWYLTLPKSTESEWTEVIRPEIEHIFRLLGPRSNKLTITCESHSQDYDPYYAAQDPILAEGYKAPCLELSEAEEYQFESDIVRSVPNAMEKYCAQYGQDTINVYWKASDRELKIPERRYELNRSGWKIVKQEPGLGPRGSHPYGPRVRLTLMRKPIIVTDA